MTPFLYQSSDSFLHRIDARIRMLCYFALQITLFVFPLTSSLILLILLWASIRYSSMLTNSLKIVWACRYLFLILFIPVLFAPETFTRSLYTSGTLLFSLILTQLWLMTTSFSQIIAMSTWAGKLPGLRTLTQCLGFTFLFIPLITQQFAQTTDSMNARNIPKKRVFYHLMIYSGSLLNHLLQEPLMLERSLLQKNYSSRHYHREFAKAKGQWILFVTLLVLIAGLTWVENFILS